MSRKMGTFPCGVEGGGGYVDLYSIRQNFIGKDKKIHHMESSVCGKECKYRPEDVNISIVTRQESGGYSGMGERRILACVPMSREEMEKNGIVVDNEGVVSQRR